MTHSVSDDVISGLGATIGPEGSQANDAAKTVDFEG